MSEQPKRVLLGDVSPPQASQKRQTSALRAIIMLGGAGIFVMIGLYLLLGTSSSLLFFISSSAALHTQETAKLAAAGLGTLLFLIALLLSPAIPLDTTQRGNRLLTLVLLFALSGVAIAAAAYLVMAVIMPQATLAEQLVLPMLILALSLILALFSPVMPIWPVNVPDGAVWAILDRGGHLLRYVASGTHIIQPIQDCVPYTENGVIIININNEDYLSRDAFPYRVRVYVLCSFNPLDADESMRVPLRGMSRASLEAGLRTQIEYAIRRRLGETSRAQLRMDQILNAIVHDIESAIQSRAGLGIRRVTDIEITLEPPQIMVDARERRLLLEGLGTTDQRYLDSSLQDLLRLAGENQVNLAVNEQGQLNFTLSPNKDIEIGQNLQQAITKLTDLIAGIMNNQGTLAAPLLTGGEEVNTRALPPTVTPAADTTTNAASEATQRVRLNFDEEDTQPGVTQSGQAISEQQATSDDAFLPQNPIDLVEDSQGVFVPRNPLESEPPTS